MYGNNMILPPMIELPVVVVDQSIGSLLVTSRPLLKAEVSEGFRRPAERVTEPLTADGCRAWFHGTLDKRRDFFLRERRDVEFATQLQLRMILVTTLGARYEIMIGQEPARECE